MPFKGINNLRNFNESVRMLPWQLEEIKKCARDIHYFVNNYVYINTKDEGVQLFKLREYQSKVIDCYRDNRFNILKFPRQSGKSITTMAYLLWYGLFHKEKVIVILANKLALAQEQLEHLKNAYQNLPFWMQPGVKQWNKRSITTAHDTRIACYATSPDAVRGMAINVLYLDEFAFVKSHIADEFIASVFPTISSGKTTKVIMTSTPQGMNHFFRMWEDALGDYSTTAEGNGYVKSEIKWNEVPGRDELWAKRERRRIGEIRFNQEYLCDFVGSVSTLIDHHHLKTMKYTKHIKIPKLPDYIKIWELPRPKLEIEAKDWEYVASLDSGYGMHADNTVLQIFLVKSNITAHQVAKMSTNSMDIEDFCKKANFLLKKYHNPGLIIEQNGPGLTAIKFFQNIAEYENLLHFDPKGKHMGIWATDKLKDNACVLMKTYVQRNFLKIHDRDTINELHAFGRLTQNKWGGLGGNHDDHVTSLYWIPFYLQSPLFYGKIVEVNIKSFAEDDFALATKSEMENTDMALHNMQDPNFKREELEKGSTYLPEEYDDDDDDDDKKEGGLFFRA